MIGKRVRELGIYRSARARASRLRAERTLRRGIASLADQQADRTEALRQSLEDVLAGQAGSAASSQFTRIEQLRCELESSQEVVEFTDFGAGKPSSDRPEEEMRAGVTERVVVGERCKSSSQPEFWCRVLFAVVSDAAPSTALELGTFLGISAAYQATALALVSQGRLLTLEGSEGFAAIARRNFESLDLANIEVMTGRFDDTLDSALLKLETIDYSFIDGHHDEHATIRYWEQLKPRLSPQSRVVFDDIHWSPGMERAWQAISDDPDASVAADLGKLGLVLTG